MIHTLGGDDYAGICGTGTPSIPSLECLFVSYTYIYISSSFRQIYFSKQMQLLYIWFSIFHLPNLSIICPLATAIIH